MASILGCFSLGCRGWPSRRLRNMQQERTHQGASFECLGIKLSSVYANIKVETPIAYMATQISQRGPMSSGPRSWAICGGRPRRPLWGCPPILHDAGHQAALDKAAQRKRCVPLSHIIQSSKNQQFSRRTYFFDVPNPVKPICAIISSSSCSPSILTSSP